MRKDFAAKVRKPSKKVTKGKPKKKTAPRKKTGPSFHGPSFSAGTILGAIIVFLMAYAPEIFIDNHSILADTENSANEPEPKIEITFPTILRESQVPVDTTLYNVPPKPSDVNNLTSDFLYQAASFRNPLDAQKLRAKLLLNNLKADIRIKTLNKVEWHRVLVGPFEDKDSADKAILKLRELSVPAIQVTNN